MKIRIKDKNKPRVGDARRKFKFCWLPKRTDDKYWVWFERVLVTERYVRYAGFTNKSFGCWAITESFSNKSTLFKEYDGKI